VLLTRTIEMACEAGWIEGELETAQDSSPVIGRGAVKDTYNLLGDAIRKLIRGIAKAQGDKPLATAKRLGVEDLFRRSTKARASIDWANPDARRRFLQQLVQTAEGLVARVDPREPWSVSPSVVEAIAIVGKIIAQDIERDGQGEVRMRQGVAEDRLISVHDPQMRRGHKTQSEAFEGFKFHHTVELKQGFILATEVTGATTHDSEPSAAMATRAEEASGCVVVKTIGDCAYGTESNRVAPKGALLTKAAFAIDLESKTVTCPQGVTTGAFEIVRARSAEPGRETLPPEQRARLFVFPPESCGNCPQRSACITDK
jgi:transposase